MKTKITILIITMIIGLTSCNKNDDELNLVKFTLIGQNNLYGNGAENITKQKLVISELNSWNELIDKMNTVNDVSDEFTETDIDFANFIVIAVFDKVYGNGGHSIDIIKITKNENKVIVTIENILGGGATAIMTQPFHIVKIPKTDKLIIFE
ncbi:protease complex subunit PrcB family protein [Lutibacter sp.]|uniref:protease complex subunit PrcB family protein n=1 Tax=Lutibacter sp. TaxID=1925666 RepID=UPI00273536AF|nr:protease complex subunit PrcB family protein [Lutibacter sp.]MDP3314060.1 protease complex subunit PrcB family protein [Lutibacter sp.]